MKRHQLIIPLFLILIMSINACTSKPAPEPTSTPQPTKTATIAPTETDTPIPTETEIPITFMKIGHLFPEEWGIPRIWSNDAFNGPWYPNRNDDHHGHVDIAPPTGYAVDEGFDIDAYEGEVYAPFSGYLRVYPDDPQGCDITLEENVYPTGILEALEFCGVDNPELEKITNIRIQFGHMKNIKTGWVDRGEIIGDIEPFRNTTGQTKIAFKIGVSYKGIESELAISPTLFEADFEWMCFLNSPYDCEPEQFDYAE